MGQVVLDTDVVSLYYKRRLPAEVQQHMAGRRRYVTFVTAGELRKWEVIQGWGWIRRAGLQLWLESNQILPYSREVAWTWGNLAGRAVLRGRRLPANDLWIASCCIERGLPLLTLNRRDFEELERHEGLRLLPPKVGDLPEQPDVRSPALRYYPLPSSTARMGGSPAPTCSQVEPASCDR